MMKIHLFNIKCKFENESDGRLNRIKIKRSKLVRHGIENAHRMPVRRQYECAQTDL